MEKFSRKSCARNCLHRFNEPTDNVGLLIRRAVATWLTFFFFVAAFAAQSGAAQTPLASDKIANSLRQTDQVHAQWLILKNGQTMRGIVQLRDDGRAEIRMASGSKLVISADSYDFVANTLDEAYWQRVARTKANDTKGQIELFRWCLKHQLIDQAQNQINIVQELPCKRSDLSRMAVDLELAAKQIQRQIARSRLPSSALPTTGSRGLSQLENQQLANQQPSNHSTPNHSLEPKKITLAIRSLPPMDGPQSNGQASSRDQPAWNGLAQQGNHWQSQSPSIPNRFANDVANSSVPATSLSPIMASRVMDTEGNYVDEARSSFGTDLSTQSPIAAIDRNFRAAENFDSQIAQVNYEESVASEPYPAMIPARQLDQESRAMPPGTLSFFKRKIEPMLMRNCHQCHHSNDVTLPLMRVASGRMVPRRMSQRNLHHVMRFVDKENPFDSPILTQSLNAHGGQKKSSLSESDELATEFKAWLAEVSDRPETWRPFVFQTNITEPKETTQSPATSREIPTQQINGMTKKNASSKSNSRSSLINSADPFDPNEFNSLRTVDDSNVDPNAEPVDSEVQSSQND